MKVILIQEFVLDAAWHFAPQAVLAMAESAVEKYSLPSIKRLAGILKAPLKSVLSSFTDVKEGRRMIRVSSVL